MRPEYEMINDTSVVTQKSNWSNFFCPKWTSSLATVEIELTSHRSPSRWLTAAVPCSTPVVMVVNWRWIVNKQAGSNKVKERMDVMWTIINKKWQIEMVNRYLVRKRNTRRLLIVNFWAQQTMCRACPNASRWSTVTSRDIDHSEWSSTLLAVVWLWMRWAPFHRPKTFAFQ